MPASDEDRKLRRLRREALRRSHPDLGGDPADFIRTVQTFATARGSAAWPGEQVRFVRRPRGAARIAGWLTGRWRRWRHPAPRRVI